MIKIISLLLIILSGFFCGMCEAGKLKNRVEFFENIISFISYLKTQMRYSCDEIMNIIADYDFSQRLKFLGEINTLTSQNGNFADMWERCVNRIPKSSGLKKDDYIVLKKFAKGLGVTDVAGQMEHCELFIKIFTEKRDKAQNDKNKKYKLYILLGTFLGICIAIVVV